MGWTMYPMTKTVKEEVADVFGNHEILHMAQRGRVWYVAAKVEVKGKEEVIGHVVLTTIKKNSYGYGKEFGYKVMDETVGPYYFDAPKVLLNKLTAPLNENAREWREKCLKGKKKVEIGDVVTFPYRLNYRGFTAQNFKKVDGGNQRNIYITVDAETKDGVKVNNSYVRIPKLTAYEGVLVNGKEF